MKTLKTLLIFLLIFNYIGCKKTHCPAFPSQLIDNYPYSKGETLKFKNINEEILQLKIIYYNVSDGYSYKWNNDCTCSASLGFMTEENNKFSIKIHCNISLNSESKKSSLVCTIYNSFVSSDDLEIVKYFADINSIFGDTIIIEKQEYFRFGSVKIVKGKGIIEFWDKEHDCFWVKVE